MVIDTLELLARKIGRGEKKVSWLIERQQVRILFTRQGRWCSIDTADERRVSRVAGRMDTLTNGAHRVGRQLIRRNDQFKPVCLIERTLLSRSGDVVRA